MGTDTWTLNTKYYYNTTMFVFVGPYYTRATNRKQDSEDREMAGHGDGEANHNEDSMRWAEVGRDRKGRQVGPDRGRGESPESSPNRSKTESQAYEVCGEVQAGVRVRWRGGERKWPSSRSGLHTVS